LNCLLNFELKKLTHRPNFDIIKNGEVICLDNIKGMELGGVFVVEEME
jgi:hypothetical protein